MNNKPRTLTSRESLAPREEEQALVEVQEAVKKSLKERWQEVMELGGKEGLVAIARLIANGVISAVDMIPYGAGEVPGLAADLTKLIAKIPGFNWADILTPDVSATVAIGTEIPDILTVGHLPSHIVETFFQARADARAGRFGIGRDTLVYLLTENEEALNRLQSRVESNQGVIEDSAVDVSTNITSPEAPEKPKLSVKEILEQIKAYREAKNRGDFNG